LFCRRLTASAQALNLYTSCPPVRRMSDKALSKVVVVFGIGPLLPSEGPLLVRNAALLVAGDLAKRYACSHVFCLRRSPVASIV
jgi:hypothetical protein